jgi:phage protein D
MDNLPHQFISDPLSKLLDACEEGQKFVLKRKGQRVAILIGYNDYATMLESLARLEGLMK